MFGSSCLHPFGDWLPDTRVVARWAGVVLSLIAVLFAALSYFGYWRHVRGDDLLDALANRIDTSYATEVSRQVKPEQPEWHPLMRVITSYTRVKLRTDKQPLLFARGKAITSFQSAEGEWTAATTPIFLLYSELPAPKEDVVIVGTLGDLHEWIKRDQTDFDFFWRTLIFGVLSACIGVFLALPDRRAGRI